MDQKRISSFVFGNLLWVEVGVPHFLTFGGSGGEEFEPHG
jgi:hypothetical protein